MLETAEYELFDRAVAESAAAAPSSLIERCRAFCASGSGRSILAMLDQVLVSAANFLILVAVARSGAAAQTGTYVLSLRTIDFITEIQNVFLWAPYTLFAPAFKPGRKTRYAGSVLVHQAVATLLAVCLLGAFGLAASCVGWNEAATVAFWSMLAAGGIHLREFVRRIGFANLDLLSTLAMDGAVFVLQAVAIGALWSSHLLSGRAALLATSAACGLTASAYLLANRRNFRFSLGEIFPDWKRNASYGRWLLGSDLALLLGNQIYPWFLASLCGPAAVAVFAACQALTNFARMFLIGAQNILLPSSARAFAAGSLSELRRLVGRGTMILASGAALFSAFCLLAGQPLLTLSYGHSFAKNGFLVFLLSLSVLATALTLAPTLALAAARRADANMRINFVTLAFHLSAGWLLVRQYGAAGAAYGLLLAGFSAALVRWLFCRRIFAADIAAGERD